MPLDLTEVGISTVRSREIAMQLLRVIRNQLRSCDQMLNSRAVCRGWSGNLTPGVILLTP